jgi:hypothetical protein
MDVVACFILGLGRHCAVEIEMSWVLIDRGERGESGPE